MGLVVSRRAVRRTETGVDHAITKNSYNFRGETELYEGGACLPHTEGGGVVPSRECAPGVCLSQPLGYVGFMNLVTSAALVITDPGGVQEETTYLGIPCWTLRDSTERPNTVSQGTNKLVPPGRVLESVKVAMRGDWHKGRCPELWDGATAPRIAESLRRRLA